MSIDKQYWYGRINVLVDKINVLLVEANQYMLHADEKKKYVLALENLLPEVIETKLNIKRKKK
jgi:hypothetical protein